MNRVGDFALVTLLALTLRLAVVAAVPDAGLFSDMVGYHDRAVFLLREGRLTADSYRGPAYPIFLALCFALPGNDLLAARIGQSVLGALTAVLTLVLARQFVSPRAALAAGIVAAAYPAAVLSTVYIMPEGLYAALLMAALVAAARLDVWRCAMAGALAGLAMLTRSVGAGLAGSITLGVFASGWRIGQLRRASTGAACAAVVCAATIAPWLVRSSRISGAPMLDSASGFNVLAGNNPRATGRLVIEDVPWLFETYLQGGGNEAEANRRALEQAWAWIREHPGAWLRLVPIKVGYLWGLEGREHAWAYSASYFGARAPATVWLWGIALLIAFPSLAIAAVTGLCRPGLLSVPAGWSIALLLVTTSLLHALSFSETRYHLPLVPVLAVLAVRGVAATDRPLSAIRRVAWTVLVGALIVEWASYAPELTGRLLRLSAPDGWQTGLPF